MVMKLFPKFKKTTLIGFGITLLVTVTYFIDPAFFRFMELKSLDLKFLARGAIKPGDETVIVAIDEKSLDEVGRWPWSRDIQAKLVNKLNDYGARVIAYDAVFSETDTNPGLAKIRKFKNKLQEGKANPDFAKWLKQVEAESDTDQQFAEAIKKSGKTVLGYFFHFLRKGLEHLDSESLKASYENIQASQYNAIRFASEQSKSVYLQPAYAAESNISKLSEAASGSGFFSFIEDDDGAIRRIPLIVSYKDAFFPPLAIEVLKLYLNKEVTFYIQDYGVEYVNMDDIFIPTDEMGKMLINFYGKQFTFPHYSASDVLNGKIPQSQLKGKIVIVGSTSVGTYDLRITPFQKNLAGAEIHATVIDNILHQRFIMQPEWVALIDLFIILISGLIITFVTAKTTELRALGFLLIFSVVFFWFNHFLFRQGIQSSIVYPLLNLGLVHGGVTIYRLFTEGKEKKFIKNAFGQYLSPTVIEQLVANPAQLNLGGERKVLTAFFSDVAGFSTISEKLSPEELVDLLNIYLTEMTDIILKYGGTVDKFEGDAIIAFFGAPIPFEDHAKRACLATIDMQRRLIELRKMWHDEGKPELLVRIGLNTGPMVVGNMGSKNRMDYTVMGDSVNLAARLEGANKQYSTYTMISDGTYKSVKEFVEVRKLDIIRVVGKSEPVAVYELICPKGELDPEHKKQIALFHDGLSCYLEQKWDKAINCFQSIPESTNNSPSSIYIKRCKEFKTSPPGSNWDGVFSLTEK